MQSKIPCTADRLGLLDPEMIQAITDASAFQVGRKYLTENRVRIAEADETQILSAVIGKAGLYEQTIRLRDGLLTAKCSCTRPEEPLCHHCIAALLEYHRWATTSQSQRSRKAAPSSQPIPQPQAVHSKNGQSSLLQPSVADITLSDIIKFMDWLQPAMKAIEKDQQLPASPTLESETVSTWVRAIKNLEARRREGDAMLASLESEIRGREAHAANLAQQLHTSLAELKSAQTTSQELEHKVATYEEALAKLSQLTNDVARYDDQIQAAARDIIQKGSHVEKLAASFNEVVEELKTATTPPPQE